METTTILSTIEYERIKQGMPVKVLAAKADITPDYYRKVMNNASVPNFVIVMELLSALNIRILLYKPV